MPSHIAAKIRSGGLRSEGFEGRPFGAGRGRPSVAGVEKGLIRPCKHRPCQRFKRGGHVRIVSLDAEADERRFRSEPSTSETPETLYERRWASTLLSAAIDRLKVDYEKRNQAELLTAMLPYLSPNAREDRQTEIAEQFGMATGAFRMNVHRMRQRYNEFLRAIIADTVEDRSEIDEELAYLLRLFQ